MTLAAFVGLAVVLSVGAVGDGSAGLVVGQCPRGEVAGTGSERETVAGWLSRLSESAKRAHGRVYTVALATTGAGWVNPEVSVEAVPAGGVCECPVLSVTPRQTDLPPPAV